MWPFKLKPKPKRERPASDYVPSSGGDDTTLLIMQQQQAMNSLGFGDYPSHSSSDHGHSHHAGASHFDAGLPAEAPSADFGGGGDFSGGDCGGCDGGGGGGGD